MKRFIAAFAALLLCASVQAGVRPDGFTWTPPWVPTWQRPVYTPTISTPPVSQCSGSGGNVFQTAYSGMYAAPGGMELDLWIAGNDLVAVARLDDGRWLEGAAVIGAADREVNVPLAGPDDFGTLTICATHLTFDGFCSRLGAAVTINGAQYSVLQSYVRNRTPANNPYCVR